MLSGKTFAEPIPHLLSATRIASWNSGRDCWETDQVDLLSGRSVVFSETLPISGSMRNGVVYEHPMLAHRMDGSGSSFSQLGGKVLPTPDASVANDGEGTETWLARRERVKLTANNGNGMGMPLTIAVQLLPAPEAKLATSGPDYARMERGGSGGHDLTTALHMLPTSLVEWGPYAAAIRRWEQALGRPAPEPTELGPKGGRRLSAAFVEWMMGLPNGWVTDPVLGLSRTQALKMLGNGVVTQQARFALNLMKGKRYVG